MGEVLAPAFPLGVFQTITGGAGVGALLAQSDLDVIAHADWVIDLGPEGGAGGGQLIAQGTPEQLASVSASHTGRYLKDKLVQLGGGLAVAAAAKTTPAKRRARGGATMAEAG